MSILAKPIQLGHPADTESPFVFKDSVGPVQALVAFPILLELLHRHQKAGGKSIGFVLLIVVFPAFFGTT